MTDPQPVAFKQVRESVSPTVKKFAFPDAENILCYVFPGKNFSTITHDNGRSSYIIRRNNIDYTGCTFSKNNTESLKDDFIKRITRDSTSFYVNGNLYFLDCVFDRYAVLSNIRITPMHSLQIENVQAEQLLVQNVTGNVDILTSLFKTSCFILGCNISTFNFMGNRFSNDTLDARFAKTNFSDLFTVSFPKKSHATYWCNQDTLSGSITFASEDEKDTVASAVVRFTKCFFNGIVKSEFTLKRSKLIFEECSFGPDANLSNLRFDTVEFHNCYNIPSPIALSFDKSKHFVTVSFANSNIVNLKFDYDKRLRLFFATDANRDLVTNTFENLLAKFKTEGKFESYQNVDIVYQKYKYRQSGLSGKISNLIVASWWYYGYRKYYIIYWTFFFLMVFFIGNLLLWQRMQFIYPIIPSDKLSYYEKEHQHVSSRLGLYLRILVYTAFIFFSLKIDFDKLNYKKSRYLVFFFLQYFIGLICVFFIANAILKLG